MEQELTAMIEQILSTVRGGDVTVADAVADTIPTEALEGVSRDQYVEAMDKVMETYDVPAELHDVYQEPLDAGGDYSPEGLKSNIEFLLENNDVVNAIDNSIQTGDYAEVHYGIDQHNDTNAATASGAGAVAADEVWGDTQTGDGVQAGDYSSVQAVGGDNSGQVAGGNATAQDITSGDGNFSNEGHINDSSIAFGGGDSSTQANDVYDESVNDSYNETNVGNTDGSYNEENVGNISHEAEHSIDATLEATVDTTGSFNTDDDGHDIDNSYNETELLDD